MIGSNNNRFKRMTCILGANCADGVVLVSDRRVILNYGASHEFEDKLYRIKEWMIVDSSGVSGLFEKFMGHLRTYLKNPNRDNTVPAIAEETERITREINNKYSDVIV